MGHELTTAMREAAETLTLERTLSDLVNQAYALTPSEIALMWQTAPPRMGDLAWSSSTSVPSSDIPAREDKAIVLKLLDRILGCLPDRLRLPSIGSLRGGLRETDIAAGECRRLDV